MNWLPRQDLNQIILEKDSIVQGLQDEVGSPAPVPTDVHQVVELTGREGRVLEGCLHKDRQIDAQYSALAGLNNLTVLQVHDDQSKTLSRFGQKRQLYYDLCQDTLSKAREVALRILQNTVYQMVEQIPQVVLYQAFKHQASLISLVSKMI